MLFMMLDIKTSMCDILVERLKIKCTASPVKICLVKYGRQQLAVELPLGSVIKKHWSTNLDCGEMLALEQHLMHGMLTALDSTALLLQPLQHVHVLPLACSCLTCIPVPWAPLAPQPGQHLHKAFLRRPKACPVVKRTRRLLRPEPLQGVQLAPVCSCRARSSIVGAGWLPGAQPLQDLQRQHAG